ncbi:hypothetical protein D1007_06380 [Hordeum vulgare]|nr:hypothetical protein D1007_06380 [Hordeum vulgare]
MFLTRGWNSFACSWGIGPGHLLHFRFDASNTLFVKILRGNGIRVECCAESSSSSEAKTASDSGDNSSVFSVEKECDDSE